MTKLSTLFYETIFVLAYFRGIICQQEASQNLTRVFLVDVGNEIAVTRISDINSSLFVATYTPCLIGKFCFANMIKKSWTSEKLLRLRELILHKEVSVSVTKSSDINECYISNVQQCDGSVIGILNSHFQTVDEKVETEQAEKCGITVSDVENMQKSMTLGGSGKDVANVFESMESTSSESHSVVLDDRPFFVINSQIKNFELLTDENEIREFLFCSAEFLDDRLMLVKPDIKKLKSKIKLMENYLKLNEESFVKITNTDCLQEKFEKHQKNQLVHHCLVKKDGKLHRGKILKIDHDVGRLTVLLVDIPMIVEELCSNENFYEMDEELFNVPCANISVKLMTEGKSSESAEKKIESLMMALDACNNDEKKFKARVHEYKINDDPIVEIFDAISNIKLA